MITVNKIAEVFVILAIGVLVFRCHIIDSQANRKMSGLLLYVVSPALIISSYQIEFDQARFKGLLMTAVLSAGSFLLSILLSDIAIKPGGQGDTEVEKISVIYSNCGFIGIPLINALLGQEGVFYMTAYITVFNILVWSHGIYLMCGISDLKSTLKHFITPSTVAVVLGLCFFMARIKLPTFIGNPVSAIGDMNTSLAMLVAGGNLAESNLWECIKRPRIYYISFLKLIVIPVLTLLLLAVCRVEKSVGLVVLVAAACPAGATGTMFALQYHKNSSYASELFTVTTLLSLVTIPLTILCSSGILV